MYGLRASIERWNHGVAASSSASPDQIENRLPCAPNSPAMRCQIAVRTSLDSIRPA